MSEGKENETKEQGFDIEKSVEAHVVRILKKVYREEVVDKLLSAPDEFGNIAQVEIETEDMPQQPRKKNTR